MSKVGKAARPFLIKTFIAVAAAAIVSGPVIWPAIRNKLFGKRETEPAVFKYPPVEEPEEDTEVLESS